MTCQGLLHGMCKQNLTCTKCGRLICRYCAEKGSGGTYICPGCKATP